MFVFLLCMSVVLAVLVLVLTLILLLTLFLVLVLILLFPFLILMMFLSTLWHMKRPTAFFQHMLHPTHLRALPSILLVLVVVAVVVVRALVVVVEPAARHLIEMRNFQNGTLEPGPCLSRSVS